MRISDWSSDVCSADLAEIQRQALGVAHDAAVIGWGIGTDKGRVRFDILRHEADTLHRLLCSVGLGERHEALRQLAGPGRQIQVQAPGKAKVLQRSEERRVGKGWGRTCK